MRASNRLHNRQSFYKYMSANTARAVLTNCSLRWSSPVLFNDPFDVPRELSFGVQPDEVVRAAAQRIAQLIEEPPEETSQFRYKIGLIIDAAKRGISEELKAELLAGLKEVVASHHLTGESMEQLRDLWRSWIPDHRILCLAESPANAAMWYHYANKYSGVVLEFKCIDELDSAWLAARPVSYPLEKPIIYTAKGWAELLCLKQDLAIKTMLEAATYTKSPDWSYESEWRIASFKRPTDTGHFTDYKFDRQELGAVYFGPMISPEDRLSLRVASGAFPDAQLWDVVIGMSRELSFHGANA